jgi:uncharacterized protein
MLKWAEFADRVEILEMLLRAGAHVDSQDDKGCTALHLVAERGRTVHVATTMARILLEGNASPSVQDFCGNFAFNYAEARGWGEMAQLLRPTS